MSERIRSLVSFCAGALFVALLFWLTHTGSLWLPILLTTAWIGVIVSVQARFCQLHHHDIPLPFVTALSMLATAALLSVIESPLFLAVVFMVGGGMVSYLLWIAVVPLSRESIGYKLVRRMVAMVLVFVAYTAAVLAFALTVFFPDVPFALLALLTSIAFTVVTGLIWQMYKQKIWRSDLGWLWAFGLAVCERLWVMRLLPFGYFASGLLLTWLWYTFVVLGRFYLSPHGILWEKQRWTLLGNLAMYMAVLAFFVRWV